MSVNSGTHLATSMWLMFTALKDTLERGLFLLTGISPKLIGHSDVNWAGCRKLYT